MEEILVATPIAYSASTKEHDFGDGITIQPLSPIMWDQAISKNSISNDERNELKATKLWLCVSKQTSNIQANHDATYNVARHAMATLQIVCPSGCKNIYLLFHKRPEGYDQIGSLRPQIVHSTVMGRIVLGRHACLSQDFSPICSGVRRAFDNNIVRIQNPVLLLEQGAQTGNPTLAILMFVMGLDMLFMAGEKVAFVKRVAGFLGLKTFVFPKVSVFDSQPALTVEEVIGDLYDFRNLIAHGQAIPRSPFREPHQILSTTGENIIYQPRCYLESLNEAAIFILTGALKKIFLDGLFDDVADTNRWRTKMTLYEHRFKNEGGTVSSAPRKAR